MMATTGQWEMHEKIRCSDFTVELHEVVIGCNFTKPFKDQGNFEFPAFGGICYFFRVSDCHTCTSSGQISGSYLALTFEAVL